MRLVGADKPKPQVCKDLEKKETPDDAADVTRGRRGDSEGPTKRGEGRGALCPCFYEARGINSTLVLGR